MRPERPDGESPWSVLAFPIFLAIVFLLSTWFFKT